MDPYGPRVPGVAEFDYLDVRSVTRNFFHAAALLKAYEMPWRRFCTPLDTPLDHASQ